MFRYLTAGESHGKGVYVIIDGIPANLNLSEQDINYYIEIRQKGYGRGSRQRIEKDKVDIVSGVRFGKTIGSPVTVIVKNIDYENWKDILSISSTSKDIKEFNVPRPGHADLAGGIKYHHHDLRNILERASARETVARVIAGAIASRILKEFNIELIGYVIDIGGVRTFADEILTVEKIKNKINELDNKLGVDLRYPDKQKAITIIKKIDRAMKYGDTLGGIVKVVTSRLIPGLGDFTQWDKKLDGQIARALMSVQAFKGVEFGAGFSYAEQYGSEVHDEISYNQAKGFYRITNNAGGIEGGMTNGEPVVVKAVVKPISTLKRGLMSVNVKTKKKTKTTYERSDTCAVPAASVIAESVVAIELLKALQAKFGTDEISEMKANYKNYLQYLKKY